MLTSLYQWRIRPFCPDLCSGCCATCLYCFLNTKIHIRVKIVIFDTFQYWPAFNWWNWPSPSTLKSDWERSLLSHSCLLLAQETPDPTLAAWASELRRNLLLNDFPQRYFKLGPMESDLGSWHDIAKIGCCYDSYLALLVSFKSSVLDVLLLISKDFILTNPD